MLEFYNPLEVLVTFFPDVRVTNNFISRIFGCIAYVHIYHSQKGKLDRRAIKCLFVGYLPTQNGYKCYHRSIQKFDVPANVTFVETQFFFNKPCLKGETILEDKENSFLVDIPLPLN